MGDEEPQEEPEDREPPWFVRRGKAILLGVFAVAFLAGMLRVTVLGPSGPAARRGGRGAGPTPTVVETIAAVPQKVTAALIEKATVVATPEATVAPQQAGWVRLIDVEKGQKVKTDQTVALIEPADASTAEVADTYQAAEHKLALTQSQLNEARDTMLSEQSNVVDGRARLAQAKADAQAAKNASKEAAAQADRAQRSLEQQRASLRRNQELYGQGALSRRDLDASQSATDQAQNQLHQARTALDEAVAEDEKASQELAAESESMEQAEKRYSDSQERVKILRERLDAQKAEVDRMRNQIETARDGRKAVRLVSPVNGVVTDIPAQTGALATPGVSVVRIKPTAVTTVTFVSKDPRTSRLKVAMPALVQVPGKKKALKGEIVSLSSPGPPEAERVVSVELPDPKHALKRGTKVTATVPLGKVKGVPVPKTAVVSSHKGPAVWVTSRGTAQVRQVKLTYPRRDVSVIAGGLAPDDVVIVRANKALKVGDRVVTKK